MFLVSTSKQMLEKLLKKHWLGVSITLYIYLNFHYLILIFFLYCKFSANIAY